ncbi:MAG: ABC transporter permease [Gemmatimonadaceae bacterium]|nr:ABC transporter permease [Gemmatimonadaceae bacterium]
MPKLPWGVRRLFRLPGSHARMLREMEDEAQIHFAMRVEELRALGMSEADADAEALRRFGDTEEFRDYARHFVARRARWLRLVDWVAEWGQDVRFAGRQFQMAPGFAAIALLTLALGIGANTAIFSVVHRLLIAPLPYADGQRIVKLVVQGGGNPGPDHAMVSAWRARARSFEMIAALSVDALALQDFGESQDSIRAFVTANYLKLLGLQPALGRGFREDEERPGAAPVAMISYGKWQREYGGRSDVLGSTTQTADVDKRHYTIIGVMPRAVTIPMEGPLGVSGRLRQAAPAIWLPSSLDSIGGDRLFAKLRPGISAAAASRELQAILDSVPPTDQSQARPRVDQSQARPRAMRAQDFLDPRETQTVQVLFVAVGVLLLIACANVANLLMSRAWTRRREFAVRTALGAGRGRLARQVLTESVLLALAGGMLGVGVAWLTLKIIVALRPPSLEHLTGVSLESTVLLWSAGISVVTGILFGSAPALFAGARATGDVLRTETRSASGGTAAQRMRSTLIVLEIAMSLVLLVGAGLLVRSFTALQRMPLGFEPHGLISANVIMMFRRDWSPEYKASRRNELIERLRAIPGATDGSIGMMPGLGWKAMSTLEPERDASGHSPSVSEFGTTFIRPNYFRLAGMSLVAGRVPDSLTWPSSADTGQVTMAREVVVNRELARRFWPNGNAVGARLHAANGTRWSESYTVVGVVDDVRMPGRHTAIAPVEIYQPIPLRMPMAPVLLRTTLPASEITASIRRTVADFDRTLRSESRMPFGAVLQEVTVGDTYLRESLAPTRFAMALLAAFSVIALVLSGVGLYGVIAYSVTQRTREIGVRVALGADARAVTRLVVGGGLRLTTLGIMLGVVAAAASTRALASLLYGVSPADPFTFAAITLLVAVIALVALYVPARRALRIDPTEALRAD